MGCLRGYDDKTLTITRIETEHDEYIYRTYKAYFNYHVGYGGIVDTLENEYNCKASEDETSFYDFTFLRQGEHEAMEKPRFYLPEPPVLDDNNKPLLGVCLVKRKTHTSVTSSKTRNSFLLQRRLCSRTSASRLERSWRR